MSRSSKQLSLEWTKNLPEEEKKEFQEIVRTSTRLLTRLLEIVDEKEQSLVKKELSLEFHQQSGYPYAQAYVNGKRAGLTEVRRLLEFLES